MKDQDRAIGRGIKFIAVVTVFAAIGNACGAASDSDTNDDLAYEFVKQGSQNLNNAYQHIDECYDYGIWTLEMLERHEANHRINDFQIPDGAVREDTCHDLDVYLGGADE